MMAPMITEILSKKTGISLHLTFSLLPTICTRLARLYYPAMTFDSIGIPLDPDQWNTTPWIKKTWLTPSLSVGDCLVALIRSSIKLINSDVTKNNGLLRAHSLQAILIIFVTRITENFLLPATFILARSFKLHT
jgi:hypothetical protein